jgi:hypothetical protein
LALDHPEPPENEDQAAVDLGIGLLSRWPIKDVGAPLYYRLLVLDQPLSADAADLAAAVTAAAAQAGVFVPPAQRAGFS